MKKSVHSKETRHLEEGTCVQEMESGTRSCYAWLAMGVLAGGLGAYFGEVWIQTARIQDTYTYGDLGKTSRRWPTQLQFCLPHGVHARR